MPTWVVRVPPAWNRWVVWRLGDPADEWKHVRKLGRSTLDPERVYPIRALLVINPVTVKLDKLDNHGLSCIFT